MAPENGNQMESPDLISCKNGIVHISKMAYIMFG